MASELRSHPKKAPPRRSAPDMRKVPDDEPELPTRCSAKNSQKIQGETAHLQRTAPIHDEVEQTSLLAPSCMVCDAISGATPRSNRREIVEAYINSLNDLTNLPFSYPGVFKTKRIQAARTSRNSRCGARSPTKRPEKLRRNRQENPG